MQSNPQNSTSPSDEELMILVGKGDMQAFEQLVRRHEQAAWSVAVRYLGDPDTAKDVVQDAFLRVLDAASRYRPTAAFRTYLFQIVSRLCLDQIKRKRPSSIENHADIPDNALNASDDLLERERAEAVRKALTELSGNQKMAIILRYYENCGYVEISEILGVSEKAAERLLARGRESLEQCLRRWMEE